MTDPLSKPTTVLLVGGYGLVGSEIARLVRARHPGLRLLLGGRHPEQGQDLAGELANAGVVHIDVTAADPLAETGCPDLVVTVVNDGKDRVLMSALHRGIAVVDITRWTARVHRALAALAPEKPAAPIVLASGWMAGLASIVAAAACSRLARVDSIFIDILYGMADRSGPDSVAYMDRLALPFETLRRGEEILAWPMSDRRRARFAGGLEADTWRLDTPEQLTLPAATGALTVETRIAFDSATATVAMVAMRKLGILALLQKPALTGIRRRLLHVSGPGAPARFTVEAVGVDSSGKATTVSILVSDTKGQAHLTAVGALLCIERALALDGSPPLAPLVHFPERFADPASLLAVAASVGVEGLA